VLVHISLNRFAAGCATSFLTSPFTHKFRGGAKNIMALQLLKEYLLVRFIKCYPRVALDET